jgi:4a-hydroxytetrahydrobiopterin dehydratase
MTEAAAMTELANRKCVPCHGGIPALEGKVLEDFQAALDGWEVVEEHHIRRTFEFADFRSALDFVIRVGTIAEEEGHHPDIHLAWGRVEIESWTHKIDGLTESDFILAAKIDRAYASLV